MRAGARAVETLDSIKTAIAEKCGKHTSIIYDIESDIIFKEKKYVTTGKFEAQRIGEAIYAAADPAPDTGGA